MCPKPLDDQCRNFVYLVQTTGIEPVFPDFQSGTWTTTVTSANSGGLCRNRTYIAH
jgi:hypothetical protein